MCFVFPYQPSVVVHSAVERKPDIVEKQEGEARKINVTATETVAKTCGKFWRFLPGDSKTLVASWILEWNT